MKIYLAEGEEEATLIVRYESAYRSRVKRET